MDVLAVERELQRFAELLVAPRRRECLDHYLDRMLREHGCAGHRFTRRWAESRARGTPDGLVRWAARLGGCCCDCEVVMNALRRPAASRRGGVLCAAARAERADEEGAARACSGVDGGRR